MIGLEDAANTFSYPDHYKILPMIHNWSADPSRIKDGSKVADDFTYTSDNNDKWMSVEDLRSWIELNRSSVGQI